jgi:hypothetical protein
VEILVMQESQVIAMSNLGVMGMMQSLKYCAFALN